jgi:hypothetical protein
MTTPSQTTDTPHRSIDEDISLAYEWCNASKVVELPGRGEGWRHTCLRLAQEVQKVTSENARLLAEVAELKKANTGLAANLGGHSKSAKQAIDAAINAAGAERGKDENTKDR